MPLFQNKVPQVTQYTTGSGTFTTPAGARYLIVTMLGGGAGGVGGGITPGVGTAGANSTFGTSLLTAAGGAVSTDTTAGVPGGYTVSAPGIQMTVSIGGRGELFSNIAGGVGGTGGDSAIGGAGNGGNSGSVAGTAGGTNTGSGGGAGGSSINAGGVGGSAGGFVTAMIPYPLDATYAYAVGAGGNAGTAGTNGSAGGGGGSGLITVVAYFQ